MEKKFSPDDWLRPLGASILITLGLGMMTLSFYGQENRQFGDQGERSALNKVLAATSFLENWFYDLRNHHFFSHKKISPHLVILNISDESLQKVGRWPWTRTHHAKIIQNLQAYGAKVVMFDGLFPEPESEPADAAFADAIKKLSEAQGAFYLGYGLTEDPAGALPVPDELQLSALSGPPAKQGLVGASFVDKNNFAAPALRLFEAKYGFINGSPDSDGVYRQQQLVNQIGGTFFPSLGLGGFTDFFADGKIKKVLVENPAGSDEFRLRVVDPSGERVIHLTPRGELKVRFFGGPNNFVTVPIEEVFLDSAPAANAKLKNIFGGKAVLIGSSAFGAHDLRPTPVSSMMPGMYMHANVFHALDENFFFQDEDRSLLISICLYLFAVFSVVLLFRFKSPLVETLGIVGVAAGLYAADYFYFSPNGYYVRLFFLLFGALSPYAWFTVLNVFAEAKEKKKIRDTFTRYVAPEIVKEMLAHPDKLKVGGEKREITMLFSDVRDFTTMSEKLTPTQLATLLNIYMGRMTDILFETGGTLDKYIGDALVGFWGAPLQVPNHAYQAVRGARMMLEALPEINRQFAERGFPQINVGIGLNTGEVSVGNMGSDRIFQYTALGDHMNLASRLESLTKLYGVNLMISEFTRDKLGEKRGEFLLRALDLVQVKGKSQAVKIFEVVPSWSPWAKNAALLQQYTEAYEQLYLGGKFPEALASFRGLLEKIPGDKNILKLIESAEALLASPPPENWNGVTVHQHK